MSKCTLSNKELYGKAESIIQKLIDTGGRSWSLPVPADPNSDCDLILAEVNERFKAATSDQWISVKDKLPEEFSFGDSDYVLCMTGASQAVCWYNHESNIWRVAHHHANNNKLYGEFEVTHWQPLSAPPSPNKEQ